VSTNETYFFREGAHFDVLAARLLPPLLAAGKPVRIWSAGCSTGEEAYTLRIVADASCSPGSPPVEIVGTDISTGVIARARQGVYRERSLKLVPPQVLARCFLPLGDGSFAIREEIRSRVQFRVHNLFTDPPPGERIQVIFCRNVMIYFDKQTQARLVDTILAPALDPAGYLCIGHAESLAGTSRLLQYASEFRAPVYRVKGRGAR